jgi:hypothetical protein
MEPRLEMALKKRGREGLQRVDCLGYSSDIGINGLERPLDVA